MDDTTKAMLVNAAATLAAADLQSVTAFQVGERKQQGYGAENYLINARDGVFYKYLAHALKGYKSLGESTGGA